MQECAPSDDVGMCALFPCHLAQAEELVTEIKLSLQDDHACDVANINSPAQVCLALHGQLNMRIKGNYVPVILKMNGAKTPIRLVCAFTNSRRAWQIC